MHEQEPEIFTDSVQEVDVLIITGQLELELEQPSKLTLALHGLVKFIMKEE